MIKTKLIFYLREFFNISKKEANATRFLVVLVLILASFPLILDQINLNKPIDYKEFEKQIKDFEASLVTVDENNNEIEDKVDKSIEIRYQKLTLFPFNPNLTSPKQWEQLGMTEKQIKTIQKFIQKGGIFKTKSDLSKIYGLRPKQYNFLEPYIQLPNNETNENAQNSKTVIEKNESFEKFLFDPNTADSASLLKLGFTSKQISVIRNFTNKGGKFKTKEDLKKIYSIKEEQYQAIEPYINIIEKKEITEPIDLNTATIDDFKKIKQLPSYMGANIIKFRESIGGIIEKEQLKKMYGMKPEIFEKIKEQIFVSKIKIKKIRINFASAKEMNRHPFLSFEESKAIVDYRAYNGAFYDIKQLKKIIPDSTYKKIEYYITTE